MWNTPVDHENRKAKVYQCLCPQIKAFEKMDHLARAQRMLELQEAENARVSSCISTQPSWKWSLGGQTKRFAQSLISSDRFGSALFLHIAGNCPEASWHLCCPSQTAQTQHQPSAANRVRPLCFTPHKTKFQCRFKPKDHITVVCVCVCLRACVCVQVQL